MPNAQVFADACVWRRHSGAEIAEILKDNGKLPGNSEKGFDLFRPFAARAGRVKLCTIRDCRRHAALTARVGRTSWSSEGGSARQCRRAGILLREVEGADARRLPGYPGRWDGRGPPHAAVETGSARFRSEPCRKRHVDVDVDVDVDGLNVMGTECASNPNTEAGKDCGRNGHTGKESSTPGRAKHQTSFGDTLAVST
jgi:hypothetical protein